MGRERLRPPADEDDQSSKKKKINTWKEGGFDRKTPASAKGREDFMAYREL